MHIQKFLQKISKIKDKTEQEKYYQSFKDEKINEDLRYGDVFTLDLTTLDDEAITYSLNNDIDPEYYLPENGEGKIIQVYEAYKGLGENVIKNSVQAFERFFESLLKGIVYKNPKAYLYDKTISYPNLIETKDIDVLINQMIDSKVFDLMWDIKATIKIINDKQKLNLSKYQDVWDEYIEIDQHRNILVHNDGIINEEYLNNVPEKYKLQKIGTYLCCDQKCVEAKTNTIIKFAYLLYYLIGSSDSDLEMLDETAFDFLKKGYWDIAEFAYELLYKYKGFSQEEKMIFKINKLVAQKHLRAFTEMQGVFKSLDVSGMKEVYKLAKSLLLNNDAETINLLKICYPKDLNTYDVQTWPIFMEFRASKEYEQFKIENKNEFDKYQQTKSAQ